MLGLPSWRPPRCLAEQWTGNVSGLRTTPPRCARFDNNLSIAQAIARYGRYRE